MNTIKKTALLLLLGSAACQVSAHEKMGSLKRPAAATDTHLVVCGPAGEDGSALPTSALPNVRLIAAVVDKSPTMPPRLQVEISKGERSAAAVAPKTGRKTSPYAFLVGGTGEYQIKISKLPAGPNRPVKTQAYSKRYQLSYHCRWENQHTFTSEAKYLEGGDQ